MNSDERARAIVKQLYDKCICTKAGEIWNEEAAAALLTDWERELLVPFAKLLDGLNPFEGGRDGDECIWCRREHPRDIRTWQEGHLPEHHAEDCEFIVAIQALAARPAEKGKHEKG